MANLYTETDWTDRVTSQQTWSTKKPMVVAGTNFFKNNNVFGV